MKRLTIILLALFLGCATVQTIPVDEGVGYSWWKDAPGYMSKDCIKSGYGLIDGFSWTEVEKTYFLIKIDNPGNGLGSCDDVILVVEAGTSFRHGAEHPTIVVLGVYACEDWDGMVMDIKKYINNHSVKK